MRTLFITLLLIITLIFSLFHGILAMAEPAVDFRSAKNIAFATLGVGSSHHVWVMEILQEMFERGHNISFYSRGDQLRFAKKYPMVQAKQWGAEGNFLTYPRIAELMSAHPDQSALTMAVVEGILMDYPSDFLELQQKFQEDQIDLAVCDAFAQACLDAAIVSKIPVVLTCTTGTTADFSQPYLNNRFYDTVELTNENESLWFRLYRDLFRMPYGLFKIAQKAHHALDFQRKVLGLAPAIDTSHKRYQNVTKLINNVFGIELARPYSPLFHMVGPIIDRKNLPSLDNVTNTFLSTHSRVAYIAFGQHAVPSDEDTLLILLSLLKLKEEGAIDGIIWARLIPSQIPATIDNKKFMEDTATIAKARTTREEILNHPDFLLLSWAPQFAILQHPNTSFFISHGGVASLHEALYSGKRLFVFPFFGDQPINARAIERANLGRFMDMFGRKYNRATYSQFYQKLKAVATDADASIQTAVQRFKAHIQIRARHAVARGADIMEECLFASDDEGNLAYRRDAAYDIGWLKRYNMDMYFVVISVGLITVIAASRVLSFFTKHDKNVLKKSKMM